MEQWDENVRQKLIKHKEDNNLTARELARRLNITACSMGAYLNGERNIPLRVVLRISDYLDVSVQYLLGLTDDPSNNLPPMQQRLIEYYGAATDEDKELLEPMLQKYVPRS